MMWCPDDVLPPQYSRVTAQKRAACGAQVAELNEWQPTCQATPIIPNLLSPTQAVQQQYSGSTAALLLYTRR